MSFEKGKLTSLINKKRFFFILSETQSLKLQNEKLIASNSSIIKNSFF